MFKVVMLYIHLTAPDGAVGLAMIQQPDLQSCENLGIIAALKAPLDVYRVERFECVFAEERDA